MKKKHKKQGLPPGSIVFTGNIKVENIRIHFCQYNSDNHNEKVIENISEIVLDDSGKSNIQWFDIRGLHDSDLIQSLGNTFDIHPLVLEDIADVHQRPKFEEYETGNFISARSFKFDKENNKIQTEQITLYFKTGFIATFQETESDLFDSVRQRIRNSKGKIRSKGSDYLAYSILDIIVDNYYLVMEDIEESISSLEDKLLNDQDNEIKSKIHALKKELLILRKSIYPLRDAIGRFSKTESDLVDEKNKVFIRDLFDHIVQVMDMVETNRDLINGLHDLYLSEVSFKMNKVMQLLTLIATIFIPLTFLAGIYGMNFDNMPELHWKYGYHSLIGIMAILFFGLLYYFKRNKWI